MRRKSSRSQGLPARPSVTTTGLGTDHAGVAFTEEDRVVGAHPGATSTEVAGAGLDRVVHEPSSMRPRSIER